VTSAVSHTEAEYRLYVTARRILLQSHPCESSVGHDPRACSGRNRRCNRFDRGNFNLRMGCIASRGILGDELARGRVRICAYTLTSLAAVLLIYSKSRAAPAEKPFGLDRRVAWSSSRLVGTPDPPPPYRLTRAFPQVSFQGPVFIAQDPESDRLLVAEYEGRIYSFLPADPSGRKDLFLDMGRGISAFSFHPNYKENGFVFVFSHADPKLPRDVKQKSRVSRFQLEPGSHPPRLRPESEVIIIEWPAGGHNGGEAIIGPDGYLYISTGDGTSGSDVNDSGQNLTDLQSVMMRLDVDHPDPGRNYSIPRDNPFLNTPGALPEIWAYGFRNPWRFSFDPQTGEPWVGDVGQDLWEMIELSHSGANHGWSVMEGSHPFQPGRKRGPTPIVPISTARCGHFGTIIARRRSPGTKKLRRPR
jgi:glucose/arabinose dehydrogenase